MSFRVWLLVLLCTSQFAVNEPLRASTPLAMPEGLSEDVHFWEQVFSKYGPQDCILHDRDRLGAVYAIKHLPVSAVQKTYATHRGLETIREAMRYLATGGEARNKIEQRIVDVTDSRLRYPAYYRFAATNVRCQRGVDLLPSLTRSKQHLRMVKRILAAQNVPVDLAYLPHLESGYNPLAKSRVGARGIWQLMPATARLYRLPVGRGGDQRTNPLRSTQAAAEILQSFYAQTGSWPLAITAYNYGINGTMRAIKLYGRDYLTVREKHHTSVFGFASRNYYPSFLAVRNVAARQEGLALNAVSPGSGGASL